MADYKQFRLKPWDERRDSLLNDLCHLVKDLDHGKIEHVSTDIRHVYVHFYRGKTELGDLGLGDALEALTEDVYIFPDGGKENGRTRERGELDVRDADWIKLQSH